MEKQEQSLRSLHSITSLYAVEEFKETVRDLEVFRKNKAHSAVKEVSLPNYLWVFQRGGGITTCVDAFAEYLYEAKIMDFKGRYKYFEFIPNYVSDDMLFTGITDINDIISDNAGHYLYFRGIACIIINHWIGRTHEDNFLKLLDFLENKNDKILSIFCVTTDDESQLEQIESSLSSYLRFETKRFRFPDTQELVEFLEKRYLQTNDFIFAKEAKNLLTETIEDIMSGENFNGFVTIKQLGNDILFKVLSSPKYATQLQSTQKGANFQISAEMLSDFHKNSAYIKSLKKISKSSQPIGFNAEKVRQ